MDKETYLESVLWNINPEWNTKAGTIRHAKYINDVIQFMSKKTGGNFASILDAPCGMGRFEPLLRHYGYEVIGIDSNSRFIAGAKHRDKMHSTDYIKADMRTFKLGRKFDVILQYCTNFGYYDDLENLEILRSFSEHLKRGGLLFLDFPNKEVRIKQTNPNNWDVDNYRSVVKISNTRIVKKKGTFMVWTIKVYKKSGKNLLLSRSMVTHIRLYTRTEIISLLKRAGFVIMYEFGSRTFKKPKLSESRSILICAKK